MQNQERIKKIVRRIAKNYKPEKIYLSSCLVNADPGCPYADADKMAALLEKATGIPVVKGTHDYH